MGSTNRGLVLPLLHIDDNADDRLLIEEAIGVSHTAFEFHGVDSVQAATDYFFQSAIENLPWPGHVGRLHAHPRPALVLLDYDLGAQCGTDFLYWLRTLHHNTVLPVVMYCGSVSRGHVGECYAHGATHFLRKAASFARITDIVRTLHVCFSYRPPRFQFLVRLPESRPDPGRRQALPS